MDLVLLRNKLLKKMAPLPNLESNLMSTFTYETSTSTIPVIYFHWFNLSTLLTANDFHEYSCCRHVLVNQKNSTHEPLVNSMGTYITTKN